MGSTIEFKIIKLLEVSDQKAITLLYEHYADALYGVIKKIIKDDTIAQDVLQESFVKIWNNASKYDSSKAKLYTWLYRIAYNSAIDKYRSISRKTDKEVQIDISNVYNLKGASLNQDVIDLKKYIKSLENKYQIVLEALFFKGLTQQEASDELNMPLGTVKSRLKIGLRELRKIYIE